MRTGYRLQIEAEPEYASRLGTMTSRVWPTSSLCADSAFLILALARTLGVVFSSEQPRLMGRSRYRFVEAGFPHFLTGTVVGWLPVFTRPKTVQIVLDSWQFLHDQERLVLFAYVVLENHNHNP
jgi:hypothetical protein